jgi:hypothetical protein
MTSRAVSFPFAVVASALAAGAAGAALRYGIVEYQAIHDMCAASASLACRARSQVIVGLMHTPALGLLALALGILALFGNRRALVIAAVVAGGFGLFLYNTELGACGLLLGALRAVRD